MRASNEPQSTPLSLFREIAEELLDIYATYCETRSAVVRWGSELRDNGLDRLNAEFQRIYFGRGSFRHPYQHSRPISELRERLTEDGPNCQRLRQSTIVLAYALWEDGYRHELEDRMGMPRDGLKSDVFGDLRWYRHALAHRHGKLTVEPKVLKYVRKGDEVLLSDEQLYDLFKVVMEELNRLVAGHFGFSPDYTLDKPFVGMIPFKQPDGSVRWAWVDTLARPSTATESNSRKDESGEPQA